MVSHVSPLGAVAVPLLLIACAARESSVARPEAPSVDRAWRLGPRDSALAGAMACDLLRTLNRGDRECVVVGYHETGPEYVVRLQARDPVPNVAGAAVRLEVRLSKDGTSATVQQMASP